MKLFKSSHILLSIYLFILKHYFISDNIIIYVINNKSVIIYLFIYFKKLF